MIGLIHIMSNSIAAAKKRRAAPTPLGGSGAPNIMQSPIMQAPQAFRSTINQMQQQQQQQSGVPSVATRQSGPVAVGSTPQGGLTLPQVIAVIDKRLLKLEGFMNTTLAKEASTPTTMPAPEPVPVSEQPSTVNGISEEEHQKAITTLYDEFNHRYELLAGEFNGLKSLLLSLQSYTMDVNRKLLEDRELVAVPSDEKEETFPHFSGMEEVEPLEQVILTEPDQSISKIVVDVE
jgi:hypothetical protein